MMAGRPRAEKVKYYKFPKRNGFSGIIRRIMSDDRIVVVFPTQTIGRRIIPAELHDSVLSYEEAMGTCRMMDVSNVIFIVPYMGSKDHLYTTLLYTFGKAQANVDIYE